MFTGIIEELGRVLAIEEQPDAIRLTIGASKVLSDLGRGTQSPAPAPASPQSRSMTNHSPPM